MRVAYICADPGVPVFGHKGCSVHVQEFVRAMVRRGTEVTLFATRVDGDSPADFERVEIHRLPTIPRRDLAHREHAALAANDDLHDALQGEGPFHLVYERYSLWSFAGMEYARAAGVRGILEVNAPLIDEQNAYRGIAHQVEAAMVAKRVFAAASALVAVSEGVAKWLDEFPETRGHVHVIPNGVDVDRFRPGVPALFPASPNEFTVGFVGSLKPWHGVLDLVGAFDDLCSLHSNGSRPRLLIVGDGPERTRLMNEVERRKLREAIHFAGAVSPDEVPGWLAAMDVAVAPYPALPSFYFSPLKVYEYMAAGLPVVASRVGSVPDLIEHDVNGLLYPAGDTEALAGSLGRLRREPDLRTRLGRAARATVIENHTWDDVVGGILKLAKTLARSASEGRGSLPPAISNFEFRISNLIRGGNNGSPASAP